MKTFVSRMAVTMSPSFADGLQGAPDFPFDHGRRHALAVGAGFPKQLTHNAELGGLFRIGKLPWLKDLVRAQRPVRLPTVLTEAEVRRLLEQTTGSARLMTAPAVRRGLEADRMPVAADQGR